MGVLPCSRKDCDNIMCDTCIDGIGYVCWECVREFKEYLENNSHLNLTTEGEIKLELEKFMGTSKNKFSKGENISVDDFFTKYTK